MVYIWAWQAAPFPQDASRPPDDGLIHHLAIAGIRATPYRFRFAGRCHDATGPRNLVGGRGEDLIDGVHMRWMDKQHAAEAIVPPSLRGGAQALEVVDLQPGRVERG